MEMETVSRMLDVMERDGPAMVIAARWLPGGGFSGYSRVKKVLNWCFQQLFRLLWQLQALQPVAPGVLRSGDVDRARAIAALMSTAVEEPADRAWLAERAAILLPGAVAVDQSHASVRDEPTPTSRCTFQAHRRVLSTASLASFTR